MKSRIVDEGLEYPKLVMYSGTGKVVLLTDSTTGTVVALKEGSYGLGYHSNCWSNKNRIDFNAVVELSN